MNISLKNERQCNTTIDFMLVLVKAERNEVYYTNVRSIICGLALRLIKNKDQVLLKSDLRLSSSQI